MKHTFYEKNNNWIVVENFDIDQFIVEVSWAPDFTQLELVFDPSQDYFPELQEKIANGELEHFAVKVAAYYDDKEMSADYHGSIVHVDPSSYIKDDPDNIIDNMVNSVVDQARTEALRMLDILKQDFLNG